MKSKTAGKHREPRNPEGRAGLPVSLYPLSFEEAIAGLAEVRMPQADKKKPKAHPKKSR